MTEPRKHQTLTNLAIYVVVCLIFNVLPIKGQAAFGYDGVDPSREVSNLGWPVTVMIMDPEHGLQLGPMAYIVPPTQVGVIAVVGLSGYLVRRGKRKDQMATPDKPNEPDKPDTTDP